MAPNFLEIIIPTFKLAARLSAAQRPNTSPPHEHPTRPVVHLNNKVAIVTGAGCHGSQDDLGNGSATAILLAEAGAAVLCVDRDLSFAERTAALINRNNNISSPGQTSLAVAVEADVTNPVDCKKITDHALSRFGRLDILINVVGVMGARGTAPDLDLDGWDAGLRVNVTSMMLMARYAVPAMLRNERTAERPVRGSIVNVGSVAGLRGGTPHLLYPTSKGAVVNMTRAMAVHHGRDGVRVNCVCPGMLYTPMMYRNGMSDEMREKRRQRSLLQTEGNVWDFAHAVRFLASDEARWITGAILPVDAGATAATSLSS
ncbi:Bacilysin biosynthesis oxidoreductase BacC [Corynascus novoguineensis]|uniref:Bacilysin biosynthesis oxidoreductase BacC n=1 Tax=Corynascus novoguineensis TaxID=1126955 RepID=A0AAN7CJT1_9PEZI|nr:Bacilysin biosynthesis oxidoreductase BacC [Corynascus novoguineensis]